MFIVVEGPDFAGKTRLVKKLKKMIEKHYPAQVVAITREPKTDSIRQQLEQHYNSYRQTKTGLLYFIIDRIHHIKDFIAPCLKDNQIVICDRFYYSSAVYQGILQNRSYRKIKAIHDFFDANLVPDLVLFLNPPPIFLKKLIQLRKNETQISVWDQLTLERVTDVASAYSEVMQFYQKAGHPIVEIKAVDAKVCVEAWAAFLNIYNPKKYEMKSKPIK